MANHLVRESVLAVDDEATILHLVKLTVEGAGLSSETTQDPHEALQLYKASAARIPVVITDRDYKRGDINGDGFAQQIRAIANCHEPPLNVKIIMVTGDSLNSADKDRIRGVGVDVVMGKPFSPRALREEIRAGLENFRRG